MNVNLDVTHSHLLHLDIAPDLLILPSRLKSGHRVGPRIITRPSHFLIVSWIDRSSIVLSLSTQASCRVV